MSLHDLNSQRLYVDAPLSAGERVLCDAAQANYLKNALRMAPGDGILVFNGRDGEWRGEIATSGKRSVEIVIGEQRRAQEFGPDIDYLFAPLKRARLDYMVQKATEMGVRRLAPVLTSRTVAERVNLKRMKANAIEAAEQCGILHIPEIAEPVKFEKLLADWDATRTIVFCDETAAEADPLAALAELLPSPQQSKPLAVQPRAMRSQGVRPLAVRPLAVLIGPEGGFSAAERDKLLSLAFVKAISIGPRIMRADTAAIAALTLVNAVLGDWR